MVENCTQVVSTKAEKMEWVWFAYDPETRPLAMLPSGTRLLSGFTEPPRSPDAGWKYTWYTCPYGGYSNYRYSYTYGYSVPLSERFNC
jgi:hypothetical protein